jgi:predicted lipoprotein with Yx(FWY)xxD motif
VVPDKRKLMVVGGAIAAALALPGCAPAGYNAYSPGAQANPAANGQNAAPAPAPADNAGDGGKAAGGKQLTTELNAKTVARMGQTVQDQNGFVLYRYDKDKPNPSTSNCNGDCAKVWLPALTDGDPQLNGVSSDVVGTVQRADGTKQLTIAGWPVYHYLGDKPGSGKTKATWKGQNVGGDWFVIKPNGQKNLTCLPPVSKAVKPPAANNATNSGGGGTSGY